MEDWIKWTGIIIMTVVTLAGLLAIADATDNSIVQMACIICIAAVNMYLFYRMDVVK